MPEASSNGHAAAITALLSTLIIVFSGVNGLAVQASGSKKHGGRPSTVGSRFVRSEISLIRPSVFRYLRFLTAVDTQPGCSMNDLTNFIRLKRRGSDSRYLMIIEAATRVCSFS